jgi:signal transduction histidine kinase/CheY-like chemotaxis protein
MVRLNNNVYKTVVIVWISLSVGSVMLAAVNWFQLSKKLMASSEAVALHKATSAVLKLLLDAETAQRGFTISGADYFLDPLKGAEMKLPDQFDRLSALARRDPVLLKQVMDLRAEAEVAMAHQRKVVAIRREQGHDAAEEIVKTREGKAAMDGIRRKVDEIEAAHTALISDGDVEPRRQLLHASLTSLLAGAIGIGAGLFAFYLARVSAKHQEREHTALEAKFRAEHESQEKSTFLANMSHEIRTPMNAILGFSELLAGELREPKHRQYLQSIRASGSSMLQLINDILDMSKVEAGVLKLRADPTDPREICDFITTVFTEPAAKKGVKLVCKVAEDLPRALLLDRVRLRQVMVNLVGNAVKFTDHGEILTTVIAEKQRDTSRITLIIEVQDTGVGIPKDKLEAIFKPFVQAGANREMEKTGTGLGLAIVQRLTQLMGGTVTVASIVGQGSAFHLRFPDISVSARLPTTDQAELGGTVDFNDFSPARILVVDDNEMNCRLVAGMFEDTHHELEYGIDGRQAVEKAQTFRPNLMLLDIRMPNIDGREALHQIRQRPDLELLPVIAVTASNLLDEEQSLRESFSGFLRKPFTRRELFDELAQFLPREAKQNARMAGTSPRSLTDTESNVPVAQAWHGLATKLRGLQVQEWQNLQDSLAINETRAFARRLEALALDANCEPLLAYAEALAHYADTYAVDAAETHLGSFPGLIERIEQSGI